MIGWMEWNGMEWNGMEWNGRKETTDERLGLECNGDGAGGLEAGLGCEMR